MASAEVPAGERMAGPKGSISRGRLNQHRAQSYAGTGTLRFGELRSQPSHFRFGS